MLNDYTVNLTNGINQTTPAPGVRLRPIYDEAWERNSAFYLFYQLAFTRRGVWGELACTGQGTVHKAIINPPVTGNPPRVKNLDSSSHKDMLSGGRFLILSRNSVGLESQCDNCHVLPSFKHCWLMVIESFADFSTFVVGKFKINMKHFKRNFTNL